MNDREAKDVPGSERHIEHHHVQGSTFIWDTSFPLPGSLTPEQRAWEAENHCIHGFGDRTCDICIAAAITAASRQAYDDGRRHGEEYRVESIRAAIAEEREACADKLSGLLTVHDLSVSLMTTTNRIRRFVLKDSLPHIVLPDGDVLFRPKDVSEWLDSRRVVNDPPA